MKLLIVHLSDMHFGDNKNYSKENIIGIVNALNASVTNVQHILIIVSGDLTYSGKQQQCKKVARFFQDLKQGIINRYKIQDIRFVMVPGNHDVDYNIGVGDRKRVGLEKVAESNSFDTEVPNELEKLEQFYILSGNNKCFPNKNLLHKKTITYDSVKIQLNLINKSIYARYNQSPEACGRIELSLDVVAEMIRYFANSVKVTNLFLVKLWKMLWYADAFSYKRRGHAISGLVYRALPMGAVPLAYQSIIDLSTINYEVIEIGEGIGYKFLPTKDKEYHHLNEEDMHILDAVIMRFGKASKNEIIEAMHKEDAYSKTAPNDIILFKYAKTLSLS